MNIESEVIKTIADHLGVPEDEVSLNSYLQDDLNSDPLSLADLIVSLEDKFKIEIPSEESSKFNKVEDIVNFIADATGEV